MLPKKTQIAGHHAKHGYRKTKKKKKTPKLNENFLITNVKKRQSSYNVLAE